MRRLQFSIWPRNPPRLNGRKTKFSRVIGWNASVACKARLVRFFLGIIRMSIIAVRIRLPYFDDPIGHRFAVAIENSAHNFHAFTGNARPRQSLPIKPGETNPEEWANGLPGCGLKAHDFSPCA